MTVNWKLVLTSLCVMILGISLFSLCSALEQKGMLTSGKAFYSHVEIDSMLKSQECGHVFDDGYGMTVTVDPKNPETWDFGSTVLVAEYDNDAANEVIENINYGAYSDYQVAEVSRGEEEREPLSPVTNATNRGTFFTTSYYGGPGIEGGPTTACGTTVEWGVIAVDPDVIPIDSVVTLYKADGTCLGTFRAEDTGGMINGNRIDLAFDDSSYTPPAETGLNWEGNQNLYAEWIPPQ